MSPQVWPAEIISPGSLLEKLLQALLLLNLLDMISTLWGVQMGIFIEANPLLRWCLNQGVVCFAVVKIGLCLQFVLISLLIARRVKYYSLITSAIVFIYSLVVIRSIAFLI